MHGPVSTSLTPMTLFRAPQKAIVFKEQLTAFQSSNVYVKITTYIETLNSAVVGLKLTDVGALLQGVAALVEVLNRVEALAKATPPEDNAASRFGNPAFKTFYDKVQQAAPQLHELLLVQPTDADAVAEVSGYFCESWGNRARIDYGSGMELNFLCWLFCLETLGVVHESDHAALVLTVFWRYIGVMRTLQSTYWLEPAGSHGVWGLDDYHFLPFLFGSAQLRGKYDYNITSICTLLIEFYSQGHKYLRPKSIHDNEVVEEFSHDYMYFACIRFINSIKTTSLRWHSPMLDDISAVKTWDKVNGGMIKMYRAEVLGKLPVMQHFLFGSILPYEGPIAALPVDGEDEGHHGHAHSHGDMSEAHAGWHDPCGIPVPSAFAAAADAEEKRAGARLVGPGIRLVPFD
ncbi:Phosphotyrosyl phosphatase activator [Russula earlei]|uniref:Phosphotyrosyl phosphatase activator n=1 Tax=Russula earlei TaxID=71964 RepID=A0ACC0TVX6_9AGAM|nr:Phosphotyrosyl phosphatase activator [Russula earlei]